MARALCSLAQDPLAHTDDVARLLGAGVSAWSAAPAAAAAPEPTAPIPRALPPPQAAGAQPELMPINVGGPPPTSSRQGRDKQRYTETGARLVAGCIPFRSKSGAAANSGDDVEVLLITSRGGKGWVFPKGGWEDDETVEAAAQRETVEEAGVRGCIEQPKVGVFNFQSNKQARINSAHQGRCVAHMFVMRVGEELAEWPEYPQRQRRWMTLKEASLSCRHQWMRDALHQWARSQGWGGQLPDGPARVDSESTSF